MRPKGNYDKLERRRNTAIHLLRQGLSLPRIVKRMKVSRSSLHRWLTLYREAGYSGLVPKRIPGRPSALTEEQFRELTRMLEKDPREHKFSERHWTIEMIRELIKKNFRVNYHEAHVWRMLKKMKWKYEPSSVMRKFWGHDKEENYPYLRGRWRKTGW